MISGATQSSFYFLNQYLQIPNNVDIDYDPHKLIKSTKEIKILWLHYAHDQPIFLNVDFTKFTHFVCVSNWQKSQFIKYLKLPEHKITVIRNGGADYFTFNKQKEKTLIYASTPFRGLEHVPYIFKQILQHHPDCKLKVFSGMKLYGMEDSIEFKKIYNELKTLPNTYYHEPISHKELANEFKKACILLYPNIWEETSCVTLIEAMRSGCYPIISDIGALPETAINYGTIVKLTGKYDPKGWIPTKEFLDNFANSSIQVLNNYNLSYIEQMSIDSCKYYDWEAISVEWKQLLNKLTKGTYMSKKEVSISKLATQSGDKIVQDPKVLEKVFDEVFRWESEDKEHAQGRSNFQIEKFIALDNFTVPSAFQAMLKNRRIMAEGLFSKVTEMKEQQREFDYKWDDKDKSKPIEWFTKDGGKKLCWYDLDYLNLQNFLKSSELEIRDRIQQIEFFDEILEKLIDMNGGPITREQFEKEDHVYWERRFANQAMDEMLSRSTGISIGNIHSMRRASAPTLVSDDVNRIKNPFPDMGKALSGPENQMEFLLNLQQKVLEGIEEVTGEQIDFSKAIANNSDNVESKLDRLHQPVTKVEVKKPQKVISPKSLFNQSLINKR
jgi:glycosyltransferase involved in cell wall biosynthesis